jgi:drug/metabolite transporter (DMT)-like permease
MKSPHSITQAFALGAVLFLLLALVWFLNSETTMATCEADTLFAILPLIAVVLATATTERVFARSQDRDENDRPPSPRQFPEENL